MSRSSASTELRRKTLMAMLAGRENISTAAVADELGVHPMTIRRDLAALQASGVVIRGHGSALASQRITFEFDFDERHRRNLQAKQAIGREAATRIQAGQTVFLDTGTTTLEVANALAKTNISCTIITTSLVIASRLWAHGSVELLLLGGRVRPRSPDLAGPLTEVALDNVSADLALLGSDGFDVHRGSFAADLDSARIASRMMRNSRRMIVVADGSKIGRPARARYASMDDIDEIITDCSCGSSLVRTIRKQGIVVTQVGVAAEGSGGRGETQ